MPQYAVVGKGLPRIDGASKVTGQARYTVDVALPHMLHGKILRSPHPHARIFSIDTARAERLPGVRLVLTGRDLGGVRYAFVDTPRYPADETPLAIDKVRYVGDEVAAVVAVDEEIAQEALELICVEYAVLPAVFTAEEAMRPDAPIIHDGQTGGGSVWEAWGAPQTRFAIDSQLDMIARDLGLDPAEVMLKNVRRRGDVLPNGDRLDSCGISECIRGATGRLSWAEKRAGSGLYQGWRAPSDTVRRGVGVSICSMFSGSPYYPFASAAIVQMQDDGRATLFTGATEMGQGCETTLAQCAAEELGANLEDILVTSGDTELCPIDMGSFLSGGALVTGEAVRRAAEDARQQLFAVAAEMLEAAPADLGQALSEDVLLEDGRQLNARFLDYRLPLATDPTEILDGLVETIEPKGPFGAKEVGEGAVAGVLGAVANAVYDAVGVRIISLPVTAEKVLRGLAS